MSTSRKLRGHVIDLVALIHDGNATDDDRAKLRSVIETDRQARNFYIDYCHMAACLRWTLERSPASAVGNEIAVDLEQLELSALSPIANEPPRARRLRIGSLSWVSAGAAIAAVLFWLVVGIVLMPREMADRNVQPPMPGGDLPGAPIAPPSAVASVIGAWNCYEVVPADRDTQPLRSGQRLVPDRVLELAAGKLAVKFDDGATVHLEGPSRFTLLSASRGNLQFGRLNAVVPKIARGFEIDTPSTLITDLGTEFSVEVDRIGGADVQVLRGEVELTPKSTSTTARSGAAIRLTQGKSVRVDAKGGVVPFVPAKPEKVVTKADQLQVSHRLGKHHSFLASSTDLIDENAPTMMRAISSETKARDDSDAQALNNGVIYLEPDPGIYTGLSALCPPDGMSVTYDLDVSESPRGYEILWIMSISGGNEGRRSQRFRVELSQVDSDEFMVLADENQVHFVDNGAGEMHVRLERSDKQPLGRHVDQIRFTFFDAPKSTATSAYREIDVFGRADGR